MKVISFTNAQTELGFFEKAVSVARNSTCLRSQCGTVIVKNGEIIGEGFNSSPGGREDVRRCLTKNEVSPRFKSDRTCCVHAEQRAIIDAFKKNPNKLDSSRLYFIRLDKNGTKQFSGEPYCTICSKMALDSNIAEFALYREEGVCIWDTFEYNQESYRY